MECVLTATEAAKPVELCPNCLCCRLFGHKWTPQIVSVLLRGPQRFSALHAAVPPVSDKVLSRRLVELEEVGIVTRTQYPEIPPRVEYELTPAGLALRAVIVEMDRWSREHASACCERGVPERASRS